MRFTSLVSASLLCSLGFAQPVEVEPRANTNGCGKAVDFIGKTNTFTIESQGRTRSFNVHLPANYNKDEARPMIMVYHGHLQTAEAIESKTRFSEPSVNLNMIVVYPQGLNKSWQGADYSIEGVDDKLFTSEVVIYVKNHFCINDNRIYATGGSNGGGMVASLACAKGHGSHFAAFAPVMAALYHDLPANDQCNPATLPVPLMETHGAADTTIPYQGGDTKGGQTPAIPEWLSRWAKRDSCGKKEVTTPKANVEHTVWTCGGQEGMLQHYKLGGWGHAWPDQSSPLDISPKIMEFFRQHIKKA